MDIEEFVDIVISRKNKGITDEIFLLIQNDKDFMKQYLELVEDAGRHNINKQIGKLIKEKYHLKNDEQRCNNPISTLISSHQEFE